MTVDEYLRGREAFKAGDKVRDPGVAKKARENLSVNLTQKIKRQLHKQGLSEQHADTLAATLAREKMKTLAALHNPDLFAGGKDFISDFGDRSVNASIGAQWRHRIQGLDALENKVSLDSRATTLVNAKLERCK